MARSGRRRAGSGSARRAAPGEGEAAAAASEADRIIEAALARIAVEGWRSLSLASVAAAAGLPLLRVYRCFSSKQAILCGFLRRIDEAVLTDPPAAEEDERPRDRLFDLLMRRLDALRPYRPALEAVDARGGRYRNRWSAGDDCGKVNMCRLYGDAAGMASRPIARSWRDNGRSRRPVAADRGLAGSGPAVAGRAAAAPRLNLLHCKTVLDAGRATADILGVVRRTTNPTPQTEPQPWLKPAPAFSTSTLPRS